MADAAFLSYLLTPDLDIPLRENTRACLVTADGEPRATGKIFYDLLSKRVLHERTLDACRLLIDRGREGGGYGRISYEWTVNALQGDRLWNNAIARYGVDSIKQTVFPAATPLPQANKYALLPADPHELIRDDSKYAEVLNHRNTPMFRRDPVCFEYTNPFQIKSLNPDKMMDTFFLWMYLVDPFRDKFYVYHATGLDDLVSPHPDGKEPVTFVVQYDFLDVFDLFGGTCFSESDIDRLQRLYAVSTSFRYSLETDFRRSLPDDTSGSPLNVQLRLPEGCFTTWTPMTERNWSAFFHAVDLSGSESRIAAPYLDYSRSTTERNEEEDE